MDLSSSEEEEDADDDYEDEDEEEQTKKRKPEEDEDDLQMWAHWKPEKRRPQRQQQPVAELEGGDEHEDVRHLGKRLCFLSMVCL
jgi:hypothetical protein